MITIHQRSGIFQLKADQELSTNIDQAWSFISNPANLSKITPPDMEFQITSEKSPYMYKGQIITYKVSPFKGFRANWVTEITQVVDQKFFIDEQRIGPYKMWHHEHHLEKTDRGVKMTDIVTYKPPFGIIGSLMNNIVIKRKLRGIFHYREKVLETLFNKKSH